MNAEHWGSITNDAQMSISVKEGEAEIKLGQPLKLVLRFRNLSTNQTIWGFTGTTPDADPFTGIGFRVISPTGKDISPKTKNKGISGRMIKVPPSGTDELVVDMSYLCKFDKLGTYKITASKGMQVLGANKPFAIVSNPLNVSVVRNGGSKNNTLQRKP